MAQSVNNLRVRRTQKLLRDALIELIEERGFDALTVGEITGRAMVSRAAFYRNYQDKYDLVERIYADALQSLYDAVGQPGIEHPPQVWVRFFDHIAEYERLYRALLGRRGSSWFVLRMRASLIDLFKKYESFPFRHPAADRSISPGSDEFALDLMATAFVEAITWWLEHGRPYSSQEIANRCAMLATAFFSEPGIWQ